MKSRRLRPSPSGGFEPVLVAACVLWLAAGASGAHNDDLLTLDAGAFTLEQSRRGEQHYQAFCAPCHVGDLSGTLTADTGAPPLRGTPFIASLQQKGPAGVFDYVKATMPA